MPAEQEPEAIEARLKETSEQCLKALEGWTANKKDIKAREALRDTVHELRKVASRLEIDMAVSERDEMAQTPIPIPAHRDSRGRNGNSKNDDRGNRAPKEDGPVHSNKPRSAGRRTPQKKTLGGE